MRTLRSIAQVIGRTSINRSSKACCARDSRAPMSIGLAFSCGLTGKSWARTAWRRRGYSRSDPYARARSGRSHQCPRSCGRPMPQPLPASVLLPLRVQGPARRSWFGPELEISGGEGGIRTHETVARLHAFQACAFDHSATSPKAGRRTIAKHPSGSSEGEATLAVHHAMLIARRFEYEPPMAYVCVIAPSGTLSSHADVVAHYGRLAAPACHGRRLIDATKSLAGGGAWAVTPMGQQWQALSPETLRDAKAAIETSVSPVVWDPVMTTILDAPTWVVFGILGVLLYWLGQKRKQVEVFIN